MIRRAFSLLASLLLAVSLTACGGGDATIGGTLSGLPTSTTVTLQNNATESLSLSANGSFTFDDPIDSGDTYAVTVLTHPVGAYCSVTNGTGTVSTTDTAITDVVVACVMNASVAGTVTGLASGTAVTLSNGTTSLAIAANGAFAFPGVLTAGTTYSVTVAVQPAGQTCSVANGAGTVVSGTASAIVVTCA
jgi:hypothetical protein